MSDKITVRKSNLNLNYEDPNESGASLIKIDSNTINEAEKKVSFFGGMEKTFMGTIVERKVKLRNQSNTIYDGELQIKIVSEIDQMVMQQKNKRQKNQKLKKNAILFKDSFAWTWLVMVAIVIVILLDDVRNLLKYIKMDWFWITLSVCILVQLITEIILSIVNKKAYLVSFKFLIDILQLITVFISNKWVLNNLPFDESTKESYFDYSEYTLASFVWVRFLMLLIK